METELDVVVPWLQEAVLKRSKAGGGHVSWRIVIRVNGLPVVAVKIHVFVDKIHNLSRQDFAPFVRWFRVDAGLHEELIEEPHDLFVAAVVMNHPADVVGGGIAETQRLVQTSAVHVHAGNDVRQELRCCREASQDNAIRVFRVPGREPVRLDGAEGMADVNNLVVRAPDLANVAIAQHERDFVERFDFGVCLDSMGIKSTYT